MENKQDLYEIMVTNEKDFDQGKNIGEESYEIYSYNGEYESDIKQPKKHITFTQL